jgi:ABC-type antimicrobial peptide transport system permease subunit
MARNLISKITDPFFLTYEMLVGNRKIIIPTMIGLIIALTVISQSGLLVDSYRQEIFEDVLSQMQHNYYEYQGEVSIDLYGQDPDFDQYSKLVNQSAAKVNYSDYILDTFWYCKSDINVWLNRTDYDYYNEKLYDHYTGLYTSSSSKFFKELEILLENNDAGRLPRNTDEIIIIRPKGIITEPWDEEEIKRYENLTLGKKVNITGQYWYSDGEAKRINKTVEIVGVLEYEREVYYYIDNSYGDLSNVYDDNVTSLLWRYIQRIYWSIQFLTLPSFFGDILGELNDQDISMNWDLRIRGKISLDISEFNVYNLNTEIKKLQDFIQALEERFFSVSHDFWIKSEIFDAMQQYESQVFMLIIILLLFSFPVLCIALYLVTYSFGLIRRQKKDQIGIVKTRGGSWLQVMTILLGEMFISTIVAVIIGFFLSIFIADVVMRSTDYLVFLGVPVPITPTIEMIQGLIFWGIVFALLLNFRNIINMSRQEITETLVPTEKRDPVWKRYYLDVVIFVIGTSVWVIFMSLIRASSTGSDFGPSYYLLYMIITLLGIPAPFLMFFGTIMVIARLFPFLMRKTSEILWKLEGGVNAFAIRNLVRHKQAANRAVLLITLALSFSILSSSLIFSLDETEHLKKYYSVGADLSLPTGNSLNNTILTHLEQNISHLTSISSVYSTRHEYHGMVWRSYKCLFVDTKTYAQTAFVDPHFKLSHSLTDLMEQLADNNSILLFEGNLMSDISKPKIGQDISFYFSNATSSSYLSFRVAGTFKYWPTMYPDRWYDFSREYWFIGSLGMFERLNQSGYFQYTNAMYQAKIDSLENIEETVERIYNVTGITPASPALAYKEYKESFTRRFWLSILNSDLMLSVAISVIGVIMFAFFTYVERGKEIGVERALGMTRFQTAQSFLVEAGILLAFGTVIGYITGAYFVTMFLQITQFGEMIPPVVVSYPIPLLIQILLGVLITGAIGTIIPAFMATRRDISRILKVE